MLREDVGACYAREQVNHFANCKEQAKAYVCPPVRRSIHVAHVSPTLAWTHRCGFLLPPSTPPPRNLLLYPWVPVSTGGGMMDVARRCPLCFATLFSARTTPS
jgi:hypothetical protein